ncbi:FMN-binding protein [Gordonia sp. SL306]|uniref:FMN-binding protein n=1 Tax=Gordonia sp. SL306 TaxID=2995145 RepID=UPI002270AEB7|nr:FMN-binding protein [Gordonia sp. SL306]WAC54381.1 FMN-binding protein [Gordonia sp. SL306]
MTRKDTLPRAAGVAAALATVGLVTGACGSDDPSDTAATSSMASGGAAGTASAAGGTYQDGEYSATGHYVSPGGPQQVGVTVTLSNSVITALSLDTSQTKGTSKEFQGKFASGVDALVVGKNIDDLDVHKVSGSSLTSTGFNDAIDQIKTEAQA